MQRSSDPAKNCRRTVCFGFLICLGSHRPCQKTSGSLWNLEDPEYFPETLSTFSRTDPSFSPPGFLRLPTSLRNTYNLILPPAFLLSVNGSPFSHHPCRHLGPNPELLLPALNPHSSPAVHLLHISHFHPLHPLPLPITPSPLLLQCDPAHFSPELCKGLLVAACIRPTHPANHPPALPEISELQIH